MAIIITSSFIPNFTASISNASYLLKLYFLYFTCYYKIEKYVLGGIVLSKKFISLFTIFCISLMLIVPVSAAEKKEPTSFPSNTIITKDNIHAVLKSLGVDPSNLVKTDVSSMSNSVRTVGELEKIIKELKKQPAVIKNTSPKSFGNQHGTTTMAQNYLAGTYFTGTYMLSYTTNLGGSFELGYDVAAEYAQTGTYFISTLFTKVNNISVSVSSDTGGMTTHKITSKILNAQVKDNGNTLELNATVTVASYISIFGYGILHVTDQIVNTTKSWDHSVLPQVI